MSHLRFRVNLYSVVDWMLRNSLLDLYSSRDIWNLSNCDGNWSYNHLVCKPILNDLGTLETHKIYLPCSCKRWTSTKIGRENYRQSFDFAKHEDILISSMTQTREKWDYLILIRADFKMVWKCHGIPCFYFYFFVSNQR